MTFTMKARLCLDECACAPYSREKSSAARDVSLTNLIVFGNAGVAFAFALMSQYCVLPGLEDLDVGQASAKTIPSASSLP